MNRRVASCAVPTMRSASTSSSSTCRYQSSLRRDARRVARVVELVLVRARRTASPSASPRDAFSPMWNSRRREEAGFVAALEFDLGTGDPVDAAAQDDVALGPDLVGREVVAQPVGQHRLTARAQLDAAPTLRSTSGSPSSDRRAGRSRSRSARRRVRARRQPQRLRRRRLAAPATILSCGGGSVAAPLGVCAIDCARERERQQGKPGDGGAMAHANASNVRMLKWGILPRLFVRFLPHDLRRPPGRAAARGSRGCLPRPDQLDRAGIGRCELSPLLPRHARRRARAAGRRAAGAHADRDGRAAAAGGLPRRSSPSPRCWPTAGVHAPTVHRAGSRRAASCC